MDWKHGRTHDSLTLEGCELGRSAITVPSHAGLVRRLSAWIRIWGDARRPWEQPPGDDIVREGSGRETLTLTILRWSTSLLEAI